MDIEGRPHILFLCVHNAGRSQMAAAYARSMGGDHVVVFSAGSDPGDSLNPAVIAAMNEVGLDIAHEAPKKLTEQMGCGDACPVYLGKRREDWDLEDPRGKDLHTVRSIRDEIADRVNVLLTALLIE